MMDTPVSVWPEALMPDGFVFGADYNPEQWPREVWRDDVARMREAGVNMVAINIFGWAQIEPADGVFDFSALDEVMDLLAQNSIGVNLGTGTATPPPWLTTAYPEVLPVTNTGVRISHGGRQGWCPSSPVFRRYARRLVTEVAKRYGNHPALRMWHVSNELGCHNALCFCEVSAQSFRAWLLERYGSIDELNRAWGTVFWSQRYSAWDEVIPPRVTHATINPTQQLDFRRFSSDELLGYYLEEREILREHSGAPVTTNFMVTAHIRTQDYWRWAPEMDLVANDHYLDHRLPDPLAELVATSDVTRGLAGGAPWFLMETATGAVNWQDVNVAKVPGELARTALSYVAHGADAVCFFQWRASVAGSEKFHSAMLPHAGTDSRSWREVVELGQVLRDIATTVGSRVESEIAMVFDWQAWWACDLDSHPSAEVEYLREVHAMHKALWQSGRTVDVVAPGTDLGRYKVLVVPNLYLVSLEARQWLDDFVKRGGHAVVTYFSGIVDVDDHVILGGYPGAFRDTLGVRTSAFHPLKPEQRLALDNGGYVERWVEDLETRGAEPVLRAVEGPLPSVPVVTRHELADGVAWYLAGSLDPSTRADIVNRVLTEAGVSATVSGAGHGVDVTRRRAADGTAYLFVINHTAQDATLEVTGSVLAVAGGMESREGNGLAVRNDAPQPGQEITGSLPVPPGSVIVLLEKGSLT